MSEGAGAVFCFVFCFGFSLALQTAGIFTPHWYELTNNETETECSRGIVYSTGCSNNVSTEVVDKTNLYLQTGSAAILCSAILLMMFNWCGFPYCCCEDNDEYGASICGCLMCFFVVISPATGFMIVLGCIITLTQHSTSMLGYSFYLCFAAGCNILFEIVCLLFLGCCTSFCGKNKSGQMGSVMVASSSGFFKITRRMRSYELI